jgi:hypothetical protein
LRVLTDSGDKVGPPIVVGQATRPIMRGVSIDGTFDDYNGELGGIGRGAEQAPLPCLNHESRDLPDPETADAFLP